MPEITPDLTDARLVDAARCARSVSTAAALGIALAAILIACLIFALGVYFGFTHARRGTFDDLYNLPDVLDDVWDGADALAMVADEGSTT